MLNQSQLRQFETQGYLVLERLIEDDLLLRIESEYDAVLDTLINQWLASGELKERPTGSFFERLLMVNQQALDWFQPLDITLPMEKITEKTPFHLGPAVFDLLNYGPLLDAVASLIGSEIAATPIQHVRIKPPAKHLSVNENRAHVGVTAWHQDRGVAHAEADQSLMVTTWCAMTEADSDNGCLMVVPGAINNSLMVHCPAGQTHIPDSELDKSKALAVEVPRGSVVFMHPSTPHASRQNQSDRFRWSFDLRYHRIGHSSGRTHFPSFVVRSETQKLVGNWQEMRDTWLETRARLALEPHISLHRWSGDTPVCA